MIDIHCHILPGLDDGAPDLEAALAMARIAAGDGIREVVATPHIFDGTFETSREAAEEALAALRAALERDGIPLGLHLGSDCRIDERIFEPARARDVLTIAGGRYLLVELPHEIVPPRFEETLFRLRAREIAPILTHPERNAELQAGGGVERIAAWVRAGLLVQVTGESLAGGFWREARRMGEELVARGLCHFVATDAHSPEWRKPVLSPARAAIERIAGAEAAELLVSENPSRAIRGEPIGAAPARPAGAEAAPARKRLIFWR